MCVLIPGEYYPIKSVLNGNCLVVLADPFNNAPVQATACSDSESYVWIANQKNGGVTLQHAESGRYLGAATDTIGSPVVVLDGSDDAAIVWQINDIANVSGCSISTAQNHVITYASFFGPEGNIPSLGVSHGTSDEGWNFVL